VLWNAPMKRAGEWATFWINDGEFEKHQVALALESGRWKLDWESLAGWSEMSWDELKETQPTHPILIRTKIRPVDYYNFGFSDENKWSCYSLVNPQGDSSLYGYVPSLGALDLQLQVAETRKNMQVTLKVRYPKDAPSDNQVLIEEVIVADGWITTGEKP
ncbi:MAG: hypothetical protein ACQKBU_09790, partial [Verrucomicrobiales bacterium]